MTRDGDRDRDNGPIGGPQQRAVESVVGAIGSTGLGGLGVNSGGDAALSVGVIEVEDDVPDEDYNTSQATRYLERFHKAITKSVLGAEFQLLAEDRGQ